MIAIGLHNAEQLISEFRAGNEAAFEVIFDHFYQRVYFFAAKHVQEDEAKDVTSEVFVKLWNKRDAFNGLDAMSAYLFVITRNRCLDIIKHEVIKGKKEPELIRLIESANEADFFEEELRSELIKLIYSEIEKLPPRMREVLLLSFRDGLKPAEIATVLGVSVQTVSNQKLTAIGLVKAALSDKWPASVIFLGILMKQ